MLCFLKNEYEIFGTFMQLTFPGLYDRMSVRDFFFVLGACVFIVVVFGVAVGIFLYFSWLLVTEMMSFLIRVTGSRSVAICCGAAMFAAGGFVLYYIGRRVWYAMHGIGKVKTVNHEL